MSISNVLHVTVIGRMRGINGNLRMVAKHYGTFVIDADYNGDQLQHSFLLRRLEMFVQRRECKCINQLHTIFLSTSS